MVPVTGAARAGVPVGTSRGFGTGGATGAFGPLPVLPAWLWGSSAADRSVFEYYSTAAFFSGRKRPGRGSAFSKTEGKRWKFPEGGALGELEGCFSFRCWAFLEGFFRLDSGGPMSPFEA